MFSSKEIIFHFIDLAANEGRALTPIQTLRLLYIANGWHLCFYNKPLLEEPVVFWRSGPMIKSAYSFLKQFGSSGISISGNQIPFSSNKESIKLINIVWNSYKYFSGNQLNRIVCLKQSPWQKYFSTKTIGKVIDSDLIRKYYLNKIQ